MNPTSPHLSYSSERQSLVSRREVLTGLSTTALANNATTKDSTSSEPAVRSSVLSRAQAAGGKVMRSAIDSRFIFVGTYGLLLIVALGAGTRASHAEESPSTSSSPAQLEEILVTAQKRAERLQDVPIPISVLTESQLDTSAIRTVESLNGLVPNLHIETNNSGPNVASIFIRGIGLSDVEKSFDPPIGVLVDGVYLGTATGELLENFDFDRVEVLRGPQGTLFGRNTTGGAISVTRSLPDGDTVNGKASMTYGNFNRNELKALVNIPIIQDKLWVKLAGIVDDDDGYVTDYVNPENDGRKRYRSANIAIRLKPSDALDIVFSYDAIDDNSKPVPYISFFSPVALPLPIYTSSGQQLYDGPDIPCVRFGICGNGRGNFGGLITATGSNTEASTSVSAFSSNATYHGAGYDVVSVTGYRTSHEQSIIDFGASPETILTANRPQHYDQWSQELRAVSTWSSPFQYVAGLYYFTSSYIANQDSTLDFAYFGAPIPPGSLVYSANTTGQKSDSYATFSQASYAFTDAMKLTVGGRYTWDHKRFSYEPLSVAGPNYENESPAAAPIALHQSWGNFTPRVSLDYRISPELMSYVSYTKGYNAGGFKGRGNTPDSLGPYNPEYVENYEAGVKSDLFDHRVRVNATVFHALYRDKQVEVEYLDPVVGFSSQVQNIGAEKINGAELELEAVPIKPVALRASFGYLDARYTSFTASLFPGIPPTNNTGLKPESSPTFTGSTAASYEFTVWRATVAANAIARFSSSYHLDINNDPRGDVPAGAYYDASLSSEFAPVAGASYKVTAFVNNLADRRTIGSFDTISGGAIAIVSPNPPRTFGVELATKF